MSPVLELTVEEIPSSCPFPLGGAPDRLVAGRWEGRSAARAVEMLTMLNALFDSWEPTPADGHGLRNTRNLLDLPSMLPEGGF